MKLGELGDKQILDGMWFRISDESLAKFKDYIGGEKVMKFAGGMFMSPNYRRPDGAVPLFPIPPEIEYEEMAQWEVVDG